jgi:hypothetical protein
MRGEREIRRRPQWQLNWSWWFMVHRLPVAVNYGLMIGPRACEYCDINLLYVYFCALH